MHLRGGQNTTPPRAAIVAIVILLLAAFTCLGGCGNGTALRTHFLLVSDGLNNRVLIYKAPFTSGETANMVLGQAGFTSSTAALSATGMDFPAATAEDSAGNIYVSDLNNNRVLQFKPPFKNGMSASLAVGQPDFVTGAFNTTQNGLGLPAGL